MAGRSRGKGFSTTFGTSTGTKAADPEMPSYGPGRGKEGSPSSLMCLEPAPAAAEGRRAEAGTGRGDKVPSAPWPGCRILMDLLAKAHLWHHCLLNNICSDSGKRLPASSQGSLFVFSPGFS